VSTLLRVVFLFYFIVLLSWPCGQIYVSIKEEKPEGGSGVLEITVQILHSRPKNSPQIGHQFRAPRLRLHTSQQEQAVRLTMSGGRRLVSLSDQWEFLTLM